MAETLLFTTFLLLIEIGLLFAQEKAISGKFGLTGRVQSLAGARLNIKDTT